MTRGRRRDPTLEPTRQLQTSRAFRERRAAHLKALEEQVESQSEEIKRLKARLGEAVDGDEDGEGEEEEEAAAALAGQPNGQMTASGSGHRRGTLSFSTTGSSSRSSMEQMSPEHGGKRRLTEAAYYGGGGASSSGDRRRPATSSGVSGSSTPQPCNNCETVRQQAHQLMLMLSDVENRMGTMRAAGVTLAQTLHHQQQQHQQQQQSQPHQPQWHSPAMPSRQQTISGPPPYSSSTGGGGGGGGGGGSSGGHAPTHRALYSIPVAASPPVDPPQLSLPSLPTAIASTSTSLPMNTPSVLAAGGMPRTPAEEKCCLGIFKCDDAGRIIV